MSVLNFEFSSVLAINYVSIILQSLKFSDIQRPKKNNCIKAEKNTYNENSAYV